METDRSTLTFIIYIQFRLMGLSWTRLSYVAEMGSHGYLANAGERSGVSSGDDKADQERNGGMTWQ